MNVHRLISGIFCVWLSSQGVWAADIVVNTVNDSSIAADGLCTLREAINNSNAGSDLTTGDCSAGTGDDVILISVKGSFVLTSDLPAIVKTLVIMGTSTDATAINISGGTNSGLVVGNSLGVTGNLTLKNLTRTGGSSNLGGGLLIRKDSSAILDNVIFSNNTATTSGGAIYTENGTLSISNAIFSNNSAFTTGGAVYAVLSTGSSATVSISNSTMTGNSAELGGAVAITGAGSTTITGLSLDTVDFYGNTASSLGGALYLSYSGGKVEIQNSFIGKTGQTQNLAKSGGGIYNLFSILTLNNTQLVNNQAKLNGGALWNGMSSEATLNNSQLFANLAVQGAAIFNNGNLSLNSVTLGSRTQPNIASGQGGALYEASGVNVGANNSQFLFNQAVDGAAVYVESSALNVNLTSNNCFVGNVASNGYALTSLGGTVNAANAWWGAPSGAAGLSNTGLGDSTSDFVSILPILIFAPAACPAADYSVNPTFNSSISMGAITVGNALQSQIQVTETGNFALKLENPVFTGTHASDFSISAPRFPLVLADGDAPKTITVQCTPSALGTRSATLKMRSNASSNEYLTLNLQCTGITGSAAVYNSSPIPNSNIRLQSALATPSTTTVTVSNGGSAALSYSFGTPTTSSGQHSFTFPQGRFAIPSSGSNLTHSISCTPNHIGIDTITLPVITNDTNLPTLAYTISCEGINTVTNQLPSDIVLSNAGIAENNAPNIVIGTFTTIDADTADSHTYRLLNDVNGLFSLNGNQLIVTQTLDYEVVNTYKITLQTTDSKGASFSKDFNIVVLDVNEQVFSIRGEIRANNAAAATMTLDNPQSFSLFAIIQPDITQLNKKAEVNVVFRFTAANSPTPLIVPMTLSQITLTNPTNISLFAGRLIGLTGVLTVDVSYTVEGNSFSAANILRLTLNENRAPTAISLNKTTVKENSANGTIVGSLQITDPDKEELINCGFANVNSKNPFAIRNNSLVVAQGEWLDYETTTQYPLTIRCIDSVGHAIQQAFVINVENVANEAATQAFYLTRNIIQENSPENTIIGKFETVKKGTENYQYSLLNDANGRFKLKNNILQVAEATLLDFEQAQSYNIEVQQIVGDEKISQTFEIQLTNETDAGLSGSVVEQNTTNSPNANLADPNNLLNTKNFDVTMTFTPDVDDVGKTAELFMLAVVAPTNSRFFAAFMLTPTGWQEWTGQLNSLQAIGSGALESAHTLTLNTVALPEFSGKISFFVGYHIGTGNLVYNLTPFNLVFHP